MGPGEVFRLGSNPCFWVFHYIPNKFPSPCIMIFDLFVIWAAGSVLLNAGSVLLSKVKRHFPLGEENSTFIGSNVPSGPRTPEGLRPVTTPGQACPRICIRGQTHLRGLTLFGHHQPRKLLRLFDHYQWFSHRNLLILVMDDTWFFSGRNDWTGHFSPVRSRRLVPRSTTGLSPETTPDRSEFWSVFEPESSKNDHFSHLSSFCWLPLQTPINFQKVLPECRKRRLFEPLEFSHFTTLIGLKSGLFSWF